jgi:hypothetical protein
MSRLSCLISVRAPETANYWSIALHMERRWRRLFRQSRGWELTSVIYRGNCLSNLLRQKCSRKYWVSLFCVGFLSSSRLRHPQSPPYHKSVENCHPKRSFHIRIIPIKSTSNPFASTVGSASAAASEPGWGKESPDLYVCNGSGEHAQTLLF